MKKEQSIAVLLIVVSLASLGALMYPAFPVTSTSTYITTPGQITVSFYVTMPVEVENFSSTFYQAYTTTVTETSRMGYAAAEGTDGLAAPSLFVALLLAGVVMLVRARNKKVKV
jgi:hypothetical protein